MVREREGQGYGENSNKESKCGWSRHLGAATHGYRESEGARQETGGCSGVGSRSRGETLVGRKNQRANYQNEEGVARTGANLFGALNNVWKVYLRNYKK